MSNQGRGRGFTNPGSKYRGGNKPGFSNNHKLFQDAQTSEANKVWTGFHPENREASGTPSPSFDNKPPKCETKNNFGNRSKPNQGRGHRPPARAFNMSNNSRDEKESDQTLSAKDTIIEGVKSDMKSRQGMFAESTPEKAHPDASGAEELSNSSFGSETHIVKTESGVFECSSNPPPRNKWPQSGSNSAEDCNKGADKGRDSRQKSCVIEIEGDLFDAPDHVSLAHCVGADLRMGSGIAVHFWEKFKSVGKLFDQRVNPGGVAYIPSEQRYVFYLITKQASKDKPTIDIMRKSLLALREKCKELHVTNLAMPQIGCGLDGLNWNDVKQMLEEIFADGFFITIYKLDKDFVNSPKSGSKSYVENHNLMLKDIQPGTGLLYIGCAEPFITQEMKSLNEKYPFTSNLRSRSCKLGSVFFSRTRTEVVYGLICRTAGASRLSYEHLEAAIGRLKEFNMKHKFDYFGLQAFQEKDDPYVMEKIETLFRNSLMKGVTFWICWPPSLAHMRLSNLERNDEGMQVQENQYGSTRNQQPSSSHSSNFANRRHSKDWKNNGSSPDVESKWDNTQRNSHQSVTEVAEKMHAQSLADESTFDPNCSVATNDVSNASETEWSDNQLAVKSEPIDSSNNTEDNGYWDASYVEDERRKSNEKRKSIEVKKEKVRQDRKNVKPKSCVSECKGDLFEAEDTMSLAHCVGADFRMGSGIAVLFRQKFGSVAELLDQRIQQGGVAYIQHEKRYIFYLVTKRESTGKPTYETLEKSLLALHEKCKELEINELAMPRIGCGLDRLEWTDVRKMLENIFADGFSIKIYNLEKDYQETKQSMPKTIIKTDPSYLKDIAPKTGLLYIGAADYYESEEMKSLNEKFPFIQRVDKSKQKLGTVVRTEVSYPREIAYGLICRQSPNDPVNFVHLKAALKQLRTINRTDQYSYFGIQAFKERGDDIIMEKIATMLRYSYIEAEAWICYPPPSKNLMSPSSSSYVGGRTWGKMNNHQIAAKLRDVERIQESTYRRLLQLIDMENDISGADGLKQKINRIPEIREEMEELFSKTDNVIQEVDALCESHKNLEGRVAVLETSNHDLEERIKVLEQRLLSPTPPYQDRNFDMNDTYSCPGSPNSLPPLLQGPVGQQVYPSLARYFAGGMPLAHPSYPHCPLMYTSEELPEEKEALMRAAQHYARENGCEIAIQNGQLYMRQNSHQRFRRISTHGDLNSFHN